MRRGRFVVASPCAFGASPLFCQDFDNVSGQPYGFANLSSNGAVLGIDMMTSESAPASLAISTMAGTSGYLKAPDLALNVPSSMTLAFDVLVHARPQVETKMITEVTGGHPIADVRISPQGFAAFGQGATSYVAFADDAWHRLRVTAAANGSLAFSVDGVPTPPTTVYAAAGTYTTASFEIGIAGADAVVHFDNVVVTSP